LINGAWYLSGIVSRGFQSVTGPQTSQGLALLNETLAEEGINGALIPYFKEYPVTAVIGQEKYFVPGLIQIETLTFNIGSVRYSMRPKQRYEYFGTPRQDNITSLPYEYHMERMLNGADVYLYFLPADAYDVKIWGKFRLDEVTDLCDDLSLIYDTFYLKYIKHALAEEMCEDHSLSLPPATAKKLEILEEKLTYVSPIDLSIRKRSSFGRGNISNYGMANLGTGWTTP
jgi:hypothetical protein